MREGAMDGRSLALTLGMVSAWGLNYVVVRDLLAYGGPLWLAMTRAGIGGIAALALLALPGQRGHLDARGRRDALLLGIPNTGAFYGLWFLAASTIPPGETAVLIYTFPLQVAVLAVPILGHRPSRIEIAALFGGLSGVALLTQPWNSTRGDAVAVGALLLAAFCWAIGTVLYQRRFRGPELREGNAYQLLGGAGVALVAAAILEPGSVPVPSPTFWLEVLYLGVVGTALAYTVWFTLLSRIRAGRLSTYTFLVPLIALTISALVTGERVNPVQLVGVALVVASIYAVGRVRSEPPDEPDRTRATTS